MVYCCYIKFDRGGSEMREYRLKFCPTCANNEGEKPAIKNGERGYLYYTENVCYKCGDNLIDTGLSAQEGGDIYYASENFKTLKLMIELKKNDPIEYSIKLAQFKEIVDNKRRDQEQERLILKCPKCGSKSITTGQKGFGLIMGLVGSNKTVNRCGSCGHIWQPNK